MAEREQSSMPEWAEKERAGDLAWIAENIEQFWSMAQLGYQDVGRGLVFVDTRVTIDHPEGTGHPMAYLEQAVIEQAGDAANQRMVKEYQPDTEFVTTLRKTQDRQSSYRLGVAPGVAVSEQLSNRVPPPSSAEAAASETLEVPDWETLEQWVDEGVCEAACPHHCLVEADGRCEHGNPSWLLKLGLI